MSEFDEVFQRMESPDYPATCNECGLEGTNASMEGHVCATSNESPAPRAGEGVVKKLNLPAAGRLISETTLVEQVIDGTLTVRPHGHKYLLLNETDWPVAEMYNEHEAKELAAEHNQHSTLVAQRDRLLKVLSIIVCHGCNNRIGWNETPTKYGDWTKCGSCQEARELITTIEQEGKS